MFDSKFKKNPFILAISIVETVIIKLLKYNETSKILLVVLGVLLYKYVTWIPEIFLDKANIENIL